MAVNSLPKVGSDLTKALAKADLAKCIRKAEYAGSSRTLFWRKRSIPSSHHIIPGFGVTRKELHGAIIRADSLISAWLIGSRLEKGRSGRGDPVTPAYHSPVLLTPSFSWTVLTTRSRNLVWWLV